MTNTGAPAPTGHTSPPFEVPASTIVAAAQALGWTVADGTVAGQAAEQISVIINAAITAGTVVPAEASSTQVEARSLGPEHIGHQIELAGGTRGTVDRIDVDVTIDLKDTGGLVRIQRPAATDVVTLLEGPTSTSTPPCAPRGHP